MYIWSLNNRVKFRTKIPMHCCNINKSRRGDFFWFTWYIHFRRLLPPDGILPGAKFTLCPILPSPILAALRHSTPAAGVSQTWRRGIRNGITELSQKAPPTRWTKKKSPPTTFVDITAMHGNFCTKFYTIVRRSNIHFITKFYWNISGIDKATQF